MNQQFIVYAVLFICISFVYSIPMNDTATALSTIKILSVKYDQETNLSTVTFNTSHDSLGVQFSSAGNCNGFLSYYPFDREVFEIDLELTSDTVVCLTNDTLYREIKVLPSIDLLAEEDTLESFAISVSVDLDDFYITFTLPDRVLAAGETITLADFAFMNEGSVNTKYFWSSIELSEAVTVMTIITPSWSTTVSALQGTIISSAAAYDTSKYYGYLVLEDEVSVRVKGGVDNESITQWGSVMAATSLYLILVMIFKDVVPKKVAEEDSAENSEEESVEVEVPIVVQEMDEKGDEAESDSNEDKREAVPATSGAIFGGNNVHILTSSSSDEDIMEVPSTPSSDTDVHDLRG